MLSAFDPLKTEFSLFVALNLILTAATAVALVVIYARHRYLLVKPSILLIFYGHVMLQWPLTVYSGYYERWLPQPFGMMALVHGVAILGLAGSLCFFREKAKEAWHRLDGDSDTRSDCTITERPQRHLAIYYLFSLCVMLALIYFYYVPIECTGIYVTMVNPDLSLIGREISLKLLADPAPRYALTFIMAGVTPLLTGLVATEFANSKYRVSWRNTGAVAILLATWFLASLNGGKANLVYLSLVIVAVYLWRSHLEVALLKIPIMLGVAMMPAVFLLILIVASPFKGAARDLTGCFQKMHLTVASVADIMPPSRTLENLAPPSAQAGLDNILEEFETRKEAAIKKENTENDDQNRAAVEPPSDIPTTEKTSPNGWSVFILNIETSARNVFQSVMSSARNISQSIMLSAKNVSQSVIFATNYLSLVVSYYLNVIAHQMSSILFRAVVVPFEVGGWYVHYLQTNGPIGIGAIPRLAKPLGIDVVNAGNRIGLIYGPQYYGYDVSPVINATGGFLFSYFAYFGYWAIGLNLALLWLLDLAVLVFIRIKRALLLPVLAASSLATLKFIESDYSAVWLSHGFGIILVLGISLSLLLGLPRRKIASHA